MKYLIRVLFIFSYLIPVLLPVSSFAGGTYTTSSCFNYGINFSLNASSTFDTGIGYGEIYDPYNDDLASYVPAITQVGSAGIDCATRGDSLTFTIGFALDRSAIYFTDGNDAYPTTSYVFGPTGYYASYNSITNLQPRWVFDQSTVSDDSVTGFVDGYYTLVVNYGAAGVQYNPVPFYVSDGKFYSDVSQIPYTATSTVATSSILYGDFALVSTVGLALEMIIAGLIVMLYMKRKNI